MPNGEADRRWRLWLERVQELLNNRVQSLAAELGLETAADQYFSDFGDDFKLGFSRAALGRGVKAPKGAASVLGLYVEPSQFQDTRRGLPRGLECVVGIEVRLPFQRRIGVPAGSARRIQWLAQELIGIFPEDPIAVFRTYPNLEPMREVGQSFWLTEIDAKSGWNDGAAWLSMYSGTPVLWNDPAPSREQAEQVAESILSRWDRFRAIVHVARGLVAKTVNVQVDRMALLGFSGEYSFYRSIVGGGGDIVWAGGRQQAYDFADRAIDVEVKSRLGALPQDPFFTVAEILLAVSRAAETRGWDLALVNVDPVKFEALAKVVDIALSTAPTRPRQPIAPLPREASETARKLVEDVGLSELQVQVNWPQLSTVLQEVAMSSEIVRRGNVFSKEPLRLFQALSGRMSAGAIRLQV